MINFDKMERLTGSFEYYNKVELKIFLLYGE